MCVVTGANKGIGLEICGQSASNGITVTLTARDEKKGAEAIENLKASQLSDVVFHQLDVKDPASIALLARFVETKFKKLDILVLRDLCMCLILNIYIYILSLKVLEKL